MGFVAADYWQIKNKQQKNDHVFYLWRIMEYP